MPIKRLTQKNIDEIGDIIDDYADGLDFASYELIDDLNHVFAKIYGYQKYPSKRTIARSNRDILPFTRTKRKPKRKLSAWNKFVKANSNKKKFQYANGKLKLKKMGIAYRKKKRR